MCCGAHGLRSCSCSVFLLFVLVPPCGYPKHMRVTGVSGIQPHVLRGSWARSCSWSVLPFRGFAVGIKNVAQDLSDQGSDEWERQQIQLAQQFSLQEASDASEKIRESERKVSARLNKEGLERIPTTRDGNCQFLAFCFSLAFP